MRRASVLGAALFVLAWLLRAPFADDLTLMSDDLDPYTGALLILQTGNPLAFADPIFPWGRELTALPLVLGVDGLMDIAVRRGALQALLAPLTVVLAWLLSRGVGTGEADASEEAANAQEAVHADAPGELLGATLAGVLVAVHPALLRILGGDYQGYFSPEWGGVFAFALVLVARGEGRRRLLGAALLGLAAMMAVSSSPYALALGGLAVPFVVADGRRSLARLVPWGLAVAVAVALMAPRLLHLLSAPAESMGGEGGSLLEALRSRGSLQDAGPLAAARYYLWVPLGGASLALALAPIVALVARATGRLASPLLARLAAGLLLAEAFGVGLSLLANHSMPWHWLPLLPAHAALLGALVAAACRGQRLPAAQALVAVALGLVVVPTAAAGVAASRRATEPPPAFVMGVTHAARVSRASPTGADWVGFTLGDPDLEVPLPAQQYGLALDAWLADRPSAWSTSREEPTGPLLVYAEGAPGALTALAEGGLPADARIALAGSRFLALELPDADAARRWVLRLCAQDPDLLPISPLVPESLPRHQYVEEPGFTVPCAALPQGDPTEVQGLHPDLREHEADPSD